MFTPLITHDSDGAALAAPVDAARRNGAKYKTRTIDDLRIKDDRLRTAVEGTGHLLFDGGMGTMLQAAGMKAGALPELLNFEEPQVITDIQRQYVEAGCDVITANTFGANAHKLDGAATVADVFAAAVTCAREAGARYVAGDIGPIGALLRPLGTLSFDEAYDLFAEEVRAGVAAGVDLFIIETMTDLTEIKAAVLACRENSDLPVFATMTFEEDGRTFLGTSPEVAAITLDAIGADVLGINCSQGPAELRGLAARMLTVTDKPVMVQANAGLPRVDDDGNTVFDIQAPEYAEAVAGMIEDGVSVVGGCCGPMGLVERLEVNARAHLLYEYHSQMGVQLTFVGHHELHRGSVGQHGVGPSHERIGKQAVAKHVVLGERPHAQHGEAAVGSSFFYAHLRGLGKVALDHTLFHAHAKMERAVGVAQGTHHQGHDNHDQQVLP